MGDHERSDNVLHNLFLNAEAPAAHRAASSSSSSGLAIGPRAEATKRAVAVVLCALALAAAMPIVAHAVDVTQWDRLVHALGLTHMRVQELLTIHLDDVRPSLVEMDRFLIVCQEAASYKVQKPGEEVIAAMKDEAAFWWGACAPRRTIFC